MGGTVSASVIAGWGRKLHSSQMYLHMPLSWSLVKLFQQHTANIKQWRKWQPSTCIVQQGRQQSECDKWLPESTPAPWMDHSQIGHETCSATKCVSTISSYVTEGGTESLWNVGYQLHCCIGEHPRRLHSICRYGSCAYISPKFLLRYPLLISGRKKGYFYNSRVTVVPKQYRATWSLK